MKHHETSWNIMKHDHESLNRIKLETLSGGTSSMGLDHLGTPSDLVVKVIILMQGTHGAMHRQGLGAVDAGGIWTMNQSDKIKRMNCSDLINPIDKQWILIIESEHQWRNQWKTDINGKKWIRINGIDNQRKQRKRCQINQWTLNWSVKWNMLPAKNADITLYVHIFSRALEER